MRKASYHAVTMAVLAIALTTLALTGCGATPTPTPAPTASPEPTGTLRPTFTPTVLAQATKEPTPTVRATAVETRQAAGRTPAPTPTPPEHTPTPAATQPAGPPPTLTGVLLFPVFDSTAQTYRIQRMDLASGQVERYIEQASQPAVTSDGKRIAWRSWDQGQRGLLSRPMDGADTWEMVIFTEAARPDWAPDNERFVFPSRQEPDRESRLYLFTGISDEPFIEIQRHGSPILGRTPAFLPDGRIIYQGCVENACGLFLMDQDGANPQQLTEFKDDTAPAVSPDGGQIAYMSNNSGYWQVNVVNADGSDQHPLTDDWYWNGLPVWSPDGQHIIFVSTRDENWPDKFVLSENRDFRLWVMDADGGNQRPLNDSTFRLDGIPAGVPEHEHWGWIEERLFWLPE
ncbi:MAG: hypothetical protein PVG56_06065 [Anaerolineae bacterium]